MKKIFLKFQAILLAVFMLTWPIARVEGATSTLEQGFSEAELDELLAPIALYPDPLLAQVIPAATFIERYLAA